MMRFLLLSLPAMILVACTSDPQPQEEMPAPEITLSDEMLDSLGREIEAQISVGNPELFDRLFRMDRLFERMMWPETPTDAEREQFMTGYRQAAELEGGNLSEQIVAQWYSQGSIRFLGVRKDSGGTKLLFRFSSPTSGLNYIEFLVADEGGEPALIDMYTSMLGENYSATMKRTMQDQSSPLRNLLAKAKGEDDLNDALTRMRELLNQGEFQGALDYYDGLPESTRRQKLLHLLRIQAASQLEDDARYAAIIEDTRSIFPNDPGLDLLLVDYYTIRERYDSVLMLIDRLDQRMHDPYLNYQRGAIALAQKDYPKAVEYGEALLGFDSTLSEPYLLLISIALEQEDYPALAEYLERMQLSGADEIAFENIDADPVLAGFAASPEYRELERKYRQETPAYE